MPAFGFERSVGSAGVKCLAAVLRFAPTDLQWVPGPYESHNGAIVFREKRWLNLHELSRHVERRRTDPGLATVGRAIDVGRPDLCDFLPGFDRCAGEDCSVFQLNRLRPNGAVEPSRERFGRGPLLGFVIQPPNVTGPTVCLCGLGPTSSDLVLRRCTDHPFRLNITTGVQHGYPGAVPATPGADHLAPSNRASQICTFFAPSSSLPEPGGDKLAGRRFHNGGRMARGEWSFVEYKHENLSTSRTILRMKSRSAQL